MNLLILAKAQLNNDALYRQPKQTAMELKPAAMDSRQQRARQRLKQVPMANEANVRGIWLKSGSNGNHLPL